MFDKTGSKSNAEKNSRSSSIKDRLLNLLDRQSDGTYTGGGLGLTEIMPKVVCLDYAHQDFLPFYYKLVAQAELSKQQLCLPSNTKTLRGVTTAQLDKLVDCFAKSSYDLAFGNENRHSAAAP